MKYGAWNNLDSTIHKHLDYLTADYDYLSWKIIHSSSENVCISIKNHQAKGPIWLTVFTIKPIYAVHVFGQKTVSPLALF